MTINSINKRTLMKLMGGVACVSALPIAPSAHAVSDMRYASAYIKGNTYGVAMMTNDGDKLFDLLLPNRGHGVVFSTDEKWGVVFARRPGTFAVAFDPANKREPITFETPEDRHFYGHGVFSHNSKLLYATENDFENSTGVIGIYDAADGFKRVGEIWSGGTGPHDILLMGHNTLVVANGGIDTHPDFGRTKLNVKDMVPNLVKIDLAVGSPIGGFALDEQYRQVSLRHLTVDKNGTIWVAGQKEGALTGLENVPLLAKLERGGKLEPVLLPPEKNAAFKGYIGAITAFNNEIMVSSPKGNVIARFNDQNTNDVKLTHFAKVCGLAVCNQEFICTTHDGLWVHGNKEVKTELRWDNHIAMV